jgi:cell division protein FtsZ
MDGAQGVLLSIAGGSDLGLFEINEAASLVQEAAHPEANIIFGTVIDDSLGDEVRVTVIAAGFEAGGPTHKKLEPAAFKSQEKPASGMIAAGVSGSTAPGGGNGSAPAGGNGAAPAGAPTPPSTAVPPGNAAQPSGAPTGNGAGHGTGSAAAQSAPYTSGRAPVTEVAPSQPAPPNQAGTLPPAAPPATGGAGGFAPAPRHPDAPRREATFEPVPEPQRPHATERSSAPLYTQPVDVADLDDDVDVPPFMKR